MPSNIEIKAKLPNGIEAAEEIAKALSKDGEIHENLTQVDTFFHSTNGRLKLRQENDRSVLIAYQRSDTKGPKLSEYVLTPVQDPITMEEALKRSNGIKGKVEKERKVYLVQLPKYALTARVHLDIVKGLGEFIEFEVIMSIEEDLLHGAAMAQDLIQIFNLQELIQGAYLDLLMEQKSP